MPNDEPGFSTLCVHGGEQMDAEGALHTPLYNHSTFGFENTQAVLDVVEGRKPGNLYSRFGMNPTLRAAERKLALLEGGEKALLFASGIAAEAAMFLALCSPGDEILCLGDIYGGSFELLDVQLRSLGIEPRFLLGDEIERLEQHISPRTRLVYLESPTNPGMQVQDIAAIAALAHAAGKLCVVDGTFASPVNQSPLALGADLVVHSATKYMGGHSDLTGGVVIGTPALIDTIWPWRKNLGQTMAPETAFLLLRSLRTLKVRVRQQNANAQAVAEFLAGHPRVKRVNYPGLPTSPGHEIAKRQMRGFGGMLSFVLDGDATTTAAFIDRLELFAIAPSLGGAESLITQPVMITHRGLSPEERARRGIEDGLVRVSIGLEDAEDLIADLRQALG